LFDKQIDFEKRRKVVIISHHRNREQKQDFSENFKESQCIKILEKKQQRKALEESSQNRKAPQMPFRGSKGFTCQSFRVQFPLLCKKETIQFLTTSRRTSFIFRSYRRLVRRAINHLQTLTECSDERAMRLSIGASARQKHAHVSTLIFLVDPPNTFARPLFVVSREIASFDGIEVNSGYQRTTLQCRDS